MKKNVLIFIYYFIYCSCYSQATLDWIRSYNGPSKPSEDAPKITVDAAGNCYITGVSYNSSVYGYYPNHGDYCTVKMNSSGSVVWTKYYDGPGHWGDVPAAIALDGSSNIYITGTSGSASQQQNFTTVKYNSNGDTLWVR